MLLQQQKMQLSAYSGLYDLIVPKDNLLRKIEEQLDFTFVNDELADKYCTDSGRNADSSIRMFKYFLLKTIYDFVHRRHRAFQVRYVPSSISLGWPPEEDVINHSSLTKFRKLRLKDTGLLNLLIAKTVSVTIKKGIFRLRSIIVDATHSLSRSNPFSAFEVLRERSKLLRRAIYRIDENWKVRMPKNNADDDLQKEIAYCRVLEETLRTDPAMDPVPTFREKPNLLRDTVEYTGNRLTFSKDMDAKPGHKSVNSSSFRYKTHIAMTEERIVIAAVVTSAEKGDGPELAKLLKAR